MLDPELITFIKGRIRSMWTLELLLLLKRNGAQPVLRAQLVRDLRGSSTLVDRGLAELAAAGLVVTHRRAARFGPASTALENLCDRLDAALAERPVAVRNAILSASAHRPGLQRTRFKGHGA